MVNPSSPNPHSAICIPQSSPDPSLESVVELLVQSQVLRVASRPDLTGSTLHHFLRHIQRQRDQQLRQDSIVLRQKSLAFKMQSFHYDITAQTIKKLPELNELVANRKLTPAQLFEKAYIKIVGQETADMVHEANRRYSERFPDEIPYGIQPDLDSIKPQLTQTEIFNLMVQNPHTPVDVIKARQGIAK
jgi:hypothetical protein